MLDYLLKKSKFPSYVFAVQSLQSSSLVFRFISIFAKSVPLSCQNIYTKSQNLNWCHYFIFININIFIDYSDRNMCNNWWLKRWLKSWKCKNRRVFKNKLRKMGVFEKPYFNKFLLLLKY